MADGEVRQTWQAYREAIEGLLESSRGNLLEQADAEDPTTLIDRAAAVSDELLQDIAVAFADREPADRELAALQLNQVAAVDLAVANYLASFEAEDMEQSEDTTESDARALLAQLLSEAQTVLATAPGGWPPFVAGAAPMPAREALRQAMKDSLTCIHADAARSTQKMLVDGLLGVGIGAVAEAVAKPVQEIFQHISSGATRLRRKAAAFVLKGVEKLLGALGVDAAAIRDWVADKVMAWGSDRSEPYLRRWLAYLYDLDTLPDWLDRAITLAPPNDDAMDAASHELIHLRRRFHDQMQVINAVASVLGRVGSWLAPLAPPWGHVGLAVAYGAGSGYAVMAGGDYIDWENREGAWLNIVPGVRTIVGRCT
jgi:hypothetical protein